MLLSSVTAVTLSQKIEFKETSCLGPLASASNGRAWPYFSVNFIFLPFWRLKNAASLLYKGVIYSWSQRDAPSHLYLKAVLWILTTYFSRVLICFAVRLFIFTFGRIGFIITKPVLFVEVLVEEEKEKSRRGAVMAENTWQVSLVRKTFYFHLPTLSVLFVYPALNFLEMLFKFSVRGLLQADTEAEVLNCWFLSALASLFLALKTNWWM